MICIFLFLLCCIGAFFVYKQICRERAEKLKKARLDKHFEEKDKYYATQFSFQKKMHHDFGVDYSLEDYAAALEKRMIADGYDIERILHVRNELSKQYDASWGNQRLTFSQK